jgi:hypothetical protein
MKISEIKSFTLGPTVQLKTQIGKVIFTDAKRKRPKHLVITTDGNRVWWFADKCKEISLRQ